MEKKRPGIMVYFSFGNAMASLTDSQCGKLFKAMLVYGMTGEEPIFDGVLAGAWMFAKASIDADGVKYNETCQKRREAAGKRWNTNDTTDANDTNASNSMQTMQMHDLHANDANDANININSNININPNINSNINMNVNNKGIFQEFAGGDTELLNALKEFDKMRKLSKAPMTDEAKKRLLNKLQKYPRDDWIPILNQSCNNNWKDIYQLKGEEPSNGRGKPVYPNAQKGASSIPEGIKWYDNT